MPAEFCLFDLTARRLANPELRKLLLQLIVATPAVTCLVAGGMVAVDGTSSATAVSLVFGVVLGYTGTLTTAAILSVGGASGGVFIAAAFALACGFAIDTLGAGGLAAGLDQLDTTARVAGGLPLVVPPSPVVGVAISVAIGIAGYAAAVPRSGPGPSLERQIGATVIGVATCLATHGGAVALTFVVARLTTRHEALTLAFAALIAIATTAAYRIRGSSRRTALRIGAFAGVIMAIATYLCARSEMTAGAAVLLAGPPTALFYSVLFALAFVIAERLGGRWAGAAAGAVGSGTVYVAYLVVVAELEWESVPLSILGNLIGLMLPWWLPVMMYPFEAAVSLLLLEARRRPNGTMLIERHPAFWDELQLRRTPRRRHDECRRQRPRPTAFPSRRPNPARPNERPACRPMPPRRPPLFVRWRGGRQTAG